MKLAKVLFPFILILLMAKGNAVEVVRINQLGYLPNSVKVAVFLSTEEKSIHTFSLHNAVNGELVFTGRTLKSAPKNWGMKAAYRLDFSTFVKKGGYYIKVGNTRSPDFRINPDVYEGTADFILNYLRQQRCGYNPYLKDSCHLYDGIIVDHPTRSGTKIDVSGGWHDASDYLQYSTTSVNTIFQMMFAYQNFPAIYRDKYDRNGDQGSNGIPDILDEIKWGLDWMLKMNPAPNEMYNQIADDRDHIGYRLPNNDNANYDLGKYRPVYFVTGKPQGLSKYKNESTGVSSIAAKFASGFALGAKLFEEMNPEFAKTLQLKATEAWKFALSNPGFSQTACNVSPYFYEERNYVDDLELAAIQLFKLTGDKNYIQQAMEYGKQEPVSPWIQNGTARHYESYPFINLGHYFLANTNNNLFSEYYKEGLDSLYNRGKSDPFFNGLPFIWCSNNLVIAAITQARLYAKNTGDTKFKGMEAALRDWLFGCNPWGTAMICGLPGVQDSPMFPHSSFTVLLHETTFGGLVDGPVYSSIFNSLIGIELTKEDQYSLFNQGKAVYHDDIGDYSTNEPTMDGTASLSYYLASLEKEGREQDAGRHKFLKDRSGAVIRIKPFTKNIFLTFTADTLFEGGKHVLEVLEKHNAKASFFFTGNFLRHPEHQNMAGTIARAGHYVGPHSDRHLLYCSWEKRDSTLVPYQSFRNDIISNYKELEKKGIKYNNSRFFMPPYEWYNKEIVGWSRNLGLEVINFTPGTGTNADYKTPVMPNYKTSEWLLKNLSSFEKNDAHGLGGAILLIHPGIAEQRTDKFYLKLEEIIQYYSDQGYQFKSILDLL